MSDFSKLRDNHIHFIFCSIFHGWRRNIQQKRARRKHVDQSWWYDEGQWCCYFLFPLLHYNPFLEESVRYDGRTNLAESWKNQCWGLITKIQNREILKSGGFPNCALKNDLNGSYHSVSIKLTLGNLTIFTKCYISPPSQWQ